MDIAHIDIVAAPANADVAGSARRALEQAWPTLDINVNSGDNYQNANAQTTLVIAIGDTLLPWLNNKKNNFAGAIAFYVSSIQFNQEEASDHRITALYRDQPLARQLQLAKWLLPNLQRTVILHGAYELTPTLADLQRDSHLAIGEVIAKNDADWPKQLSQAMRDHDLLVGIDDPIIYNSNTIRSILLTTYRHGKGVIGPSRAFVAAGSLASCYTASDQYLQQLLAMVTATIQEHKLPRPQYPKQFRVAVNPQVAVSLGLTLPNEEALTAWSQTHTGDCGNGC